MPQMTMADVSEAMARIDFCMLSTHAAGGEIASRPMSNNGDVEYKGDSFFFALGSTHTVGEIEKNNQVSLSFSGSSGLLGQRPLFIAVEGDATLHRDRAAFGEHWVKDLDTWFEQGIDTPGLTLIQVHAKRITYWNGTDEGHLTPA